jgi:putative transcriptional regulator
LVPATRKYRPSRISYGFIKLVSLLILPTLLLPNASTLAKTSDRQTGRIIKDGQFRVQKPGRLRSGSGLAPGTFLVADRNLRDPNFYRTVVLLIRYGQNGASGLVINRPLDLKLSSIMPDFEELKGRKDSLYLGGPVEKDKMLLLVKSAKPPLESMPVFDDIYISSSRKELRRLIRTAGKDEQFRIYAGYAGWAPGQLESECDRGDWHVLKADAGTLFDQKPAEIWQELIHRVTASWVYLKDSDALNVQRTKGSKYEIQTIGKKWIESLGVVPRDHDIWRRMGFRGE